MTQTYLNGRVLMAQAEFERIRNGQLQILADTMYRRGYRAGELIIFHHEAEIEALISDDGDDVVVLDMSQVYLAPRQPFPALRLLLRQILRRIHPYRRSIACIERRVFPCC